MQNLLTTFMRSEEVTEMTSDRRTEETNTKDINAQQKEGFMTAIQKQHRRSSVRKILQTFSAQRKDIDQKPLKEATEEEVTAIILRWILDNLPAEGSILMRSRDNDGDVFELRIHKQRGSIYARSVRQLKDTKRLYLWRRKVTYNDLTIEEIEKSISSAEKINRRKQRRKAKCEESTPNEVNELSTQTCDLGAE